MGMGMGMGMMMARIEMKGIMRHENSDSLVLPSFCELVFLIQLYEI
jgi:hypothetical protein